MKVFLFFHALVPHLTGKYLAEVFPSFFMKNFPYHNVRIFQCIRPGCGKSLAEEEMYPLDRLNPRTICPQCWSEMTSVFTEECWVCGDYIEDWRVEMQKIQPSRIQLRMHDLRCRDYWTILSAKALGKDMSFLGDETDDFVKEHPQFIDIEYQEVSPVQ